MTGERFDADWLGLREPVDHRSRSRTLSMRFLAACKRARPIADLGAGTGSNMRYLQGLASERMKWRAIDRDADLLARSAGAGQDVEAVVADLSAIDGLGLDGVGGVTAAALVDLVSEPWLGALAERCAHLEIPVLFALNVDGRVVFDPEDGDDAPILARFGQDQGRDKGLGPALGNAGPGRARRLFAAQGFSVRRARSDWVLTGDDADLMTHYLQGIARAAMAASASDHGRIEAWLDRRLAALRKRALTVTVGHEDVLAVAA